MTLWHDLADVSGIISPVPVPSVIKGSSHAGLKMLMRGVYVPSCWCNKLALERRFITTCKALSRRNTCKTPPRARMKADWLLESKAGHVDNFVPGMGVAAYEFVKLGKHDLKFRSPDDPSRYITPDELADLCKPFIKDYPAVLLNILLIKITGELGQCRNPGRGGWSHKEEP